MKETLPRVHELFDCTCTIASPLFRRDSYPWELLDDISTFIRDYGPTLDPARFEHRSGHVYIARTASVAPTAYIGDYTIIDEHAEIRHGAYIRCSAVIGKHAVVGNSCELKNCILFDEVQVPHFNYVGDSILGYKSHTGAGAITSNVKSDKTLVTVKTENGVIETGLKKFGAMLGDFVEVGCNSVLNPGSVVGRNTSIYPLSFVRGYVSANRIYKRLGEVAKKV